MERTATVARAYAALFLVAFVLSVVMLRTDTNLWTGFGSMPKGYYAHWDGVLVMAIADLVGAALLLVVASRKAILAGTVGSGLLALASVGIIATYAQAGFASAGDFANYLFGVTYYGGDIRYLYDALLAVYVVTFGVGCGVLAMTRARGAGPAPP